MKTHARWLKLSWSISRGRDTYGYNICRLDDLDTGQRYRCMGGGYDMVGTVFADWLQSTHQGRLIKFFAATDQSKIKPYGNPSAELLQHVDYYGMTYWPAERISLDGVCGLESMIRIAEAIGVSVDKQYNRRANRTDGFFTFWSEA